MLESRNKRIRYNLKVAVKTRDMSKLPKAVDDFKKSKLPDDDLDLEKGERILKEAMARDGKVFNTYMVRVGGGLWLEMVRSNTCMMRVGEAMTRDGKFFNVWWE